MAPSESSLMVLTTPVIGRESSVAMIEAKSMIYVSFCLEIPKI